MFRSARLNVMSAFFFFNDTATTEIYTLSLHDALPISQLRASGWNGHWIDAASSIQWPFQPERSEEHTSELQSPDHIVCRLLLEKKNSAYPDILHLHT